MEMAMPCNNIESKRNHTIDLLKAIFCMCMILVHFPFKGALGTVFSTIGICGVIFFFLVSGYSAYNQDDTIACQNLMKRFKRNLKITLIVLAIYAVLIPIEQLVTGQFDNFLSYFKNPWLFPRIIFLGDFSVIKADPLWFMPALLYAYLIFYLLHKYHKMKYAYYFLPPLLLLRIGVEIYVNTTNADWHISTNVLVGALPIMLLGHFIACKKDAFFKTPIYITISLFIITTALTFVSVFVRVSNIDIAQIFKIWSMTELFLISLRFPGKEERTILEIIGRRYSLYIYLFHFLIGVIFVCDVLYAFKAPDWVYDYILPIMALILGTIIPIGLYDLNHHIKNKRKGAVKKLN